MTQKREHLKAEPRTITGKQVKKLRRTGILPANIYGRDFKSTSIQVPTKEFEKVYAIAQGTGLVDVEVNGEIHPVLIQNVAEDHNKNEFLHADFYKVNLKEKITAKIPVEGVGEAKAETDKVGLLEQPVSEIEIEALPTELPDKIEVDVTNLAVVGDQVIVEQLTIPTGVTVLSEPSQVVFKIGELVSKETEEVLAEAEAEAEAAAAETAEGEAAADGEVKKEGEAGEDLPAGKAGKAAEAGATSGEPKEEKKEEKSEEPPKEKS